jgi:type III pantothenate kinase
MLLAIDVGNTNAAFALYDGARRISDWRIPLGSFASSDELASTLGGRFASVGRALGDVDGIAISSVVPDRTATFLSVCRAAFHADPLLIGPNTDLGLDVRYRPSGDVGTDRLLDAAMALDRYGPAPLIVVDAGSATTFNAVGAPNVFLGGAICPGIAVAWDAMFERAARLAPVEFAAPPSALADNTVHAIQSGIVFGSAAMVDGMVRRIQAAMHAPNCRVIATGGNLSEAIANACETIATVDPWLTLDGLALAYGLNRARGEW